MCQPVCRVGLSWLLGRLEVDVAIISDAPFLHLGQFIAMVRNKSTTSVRKFYVKETTEQSSACPLVERRSYHVENRFHATCETLAGRLTCELKMPLRTSPDRGMRTGECETRLRASSRSAIERS